MASGLDIAGVAISAVELVVEFVFCYFVWREFKMTRKSFEWMEEERKEKKDKEANRQLQEIIKFFLVEYYKFLYERCLMKGNNNIELLRDPKESEIIEGLIKKYNINLMIKRGLKQKKINVCKKEREILKSIIGRFVIYDLDPNVIIIDFVKKKFGALVVNCKLQELEKIDDECINYIQNKYFLQPETITTMDIDYKILEKIYYNIKYGKKFK